MVKKFKSLLKDTSGNVAMMLGLAIVPMILVAGVAVDVVQTNNTRAIMNGAADAAALAGAASGETDKTKLNAIVEKYLKANGVGHVMSEIDDIEGKLDSKKGTFAVTLTGKRNTSLMYMMGFKQMDVGAYSEVTLGGDALEVALVLDVTSSMNASGRMPALKDAATEIVTDLLKSKGTGPYVKVGIVPFSQYVNVGLSRRKANWLQVDDDTSETKYSCWNTYPDAKSYDCVDVPYIIDGVDQGTMTQSCKWDYGAPKEVCGDVTNSITWYGCVGSRSSGYDTKITKPTVERYPGMMNTLCATELVDLTDDKSALHATIASFNGVGETYIPQGLLWGWNMLDNNAPLTEAKSAGYMKDRKGTKALVLMTDGESTLYSSGPYHWTAGPSEKDITNDKQDELCDSIKDDDIVIYTVSFMITDAAATKRMKDCATIPSMAFAADNPAELKKAFKDIADSLQAMRLSQ
jgi:Flp pilus assembly protein TadG